MTDGADIGTTVSSRLTGAVMQKGEAMDDTISRAAVLDEIHKYMEERDYTIGTLYDNICEMPSAQQWIPFKTRQLTEEEKGEHPEWDSILDCKLPDDGQRILVSVSVRGHERVQYDEFYTDDGCYLDSGYEIGTEAVAWMPLPEPYKGDDDAR